MNIFFSWNNQHEHECYEKRLPSFWETYKRFSSHSCAILNIIIMEIIGIVIMCVHDYTRSNNINDDNHIMGLYLLFLFFLDITFYNSTCLHENRIPKR